MVSFNFENLLNTLEYDNYGTSMKYNKPKYPLSKSFKKVENYHWFKPSRSNKINHLFYRSYYMYHIYYFCT